MENTMCCETGFCPTSEVPSLLLLVGSFVCFVHAFAKPKCFIAPMPMEASDATRAAPGRMPAERFFRRGISVAAE
jgi:hypothetical protein